MSLDLIVRGAAVYPGAGPPSVADVAVSADRIETVAPSLAGLEAAEIGDGTGLMLCPGFIDMHAHSALRSFDQPLLEPKIAQGFTTELINPDGLAPAPVAPDRRAERQAYLRGLEGSGPAGWPRARRGTRRTSTTATRRARFPRGRGDTPDAPPAGRERRVPARGSPG